MPTESPWYTTNPHHVNGDMLTPVGTLPTSRPEGRKVLNHASWSCGFTAQIFCGRKKRIGLENRSSCRNYLKMTVNVENALVVWTWSSVAKCWNHFCPTIPPGIVFWKAVAWLVRFKRYLVGLPNKDLDSIPKKPLTVTEVIAVESVVIKAVQHDVFSLELAVVGQRASGNQRKCVPRFSPICKLNPFVSEGILRVGGRLENAPVSFETGAYWISMTSWIPQLHVIQILYYLFLHIRAYK